MLDGFVDGDMTWHVFNYGLTWITIMVVGHITQVVDRRESLLV
jgi:hypothetical protein